MDSVREKVSRARREHQEVKRLIEREIANLEDMLGIDPGFDWDWHSIMGQEGDGLDQFGDCW